MTKLGVCASLGHLEINSTEVRGGKLTQKTTGIAPKIVIHRVVVVEYGEKDNLPIKVELFDVSGKRVGIVTREDGKAVTEFNPARDVFAQGSIESVLFKAMAVRQCRLVVPVRPSTQ